MPAFLFSCENATCAVPEAFRELFRGSEEIVASTDGWEPGALNLAQGFAMKFRTPLVHGDVTRLLIDLESDGEDRWSRFSQKLPEATRVKLVDRHERPYRSMLLQRIAEDLRRHPALIHVMVHTDERDHEGIILETPPAVPLAEEYANAWRRKLDDSGVNIRQVTASEGPALAVAMGAAFPEGRYAQIRLRVAQSYFLAARPMRWEAVKKYLLETLAASAPEVDAKSRK